MAILAVTRMRLDEHPLAGGRHFVQQSPVALLIFFVISEPRLLEIHVIVEPQSAAVFERPYRSADGGQCRHDAGEEPFIKLTGRHLRARESLNLVDQRAELLPRLINNFGIKR